MSENNSFRLRHRRNLKIITSPKYPYSAIYNVIPEAV